jgi:4-hydroxy-tetrahydrodipicolinate reductase
MDTINVLVHGAAGKVGQEIISTLGTEPGLRLVGAVDIKADQAYLELPGKAGKVPYATSLDSLLTSIKPDVIVDFTVSKAAMPAIRLAASRHVNLVIGTTGFTADEISEMDSLAQKYQVGMVLAPNYALGAVLMMHLAAIAARYFNYAEIIELHHETKIDAPSGTALSTAKAMASARDKGFLVPQGKPSAARGQQVDGVTIHSVRLPGLLAHQEVLFGGPGQTLSIRHDTINRQCFMPGVMLAIREVVNRKGLTFGLDKLLGF